ncbi:hypothetical protein ACQ4PT_009939 [Festuca glaucescens]
MGLLPTKKNTGIAMGPTGSSLFKDPVWCFVEIIQPPTHTGTEKGSLSFLSPLHLHSKLRRSLPSRSISSTPEAAMVSAHTIRTVVGVIGNVTAGALVLSPVPTFYGIWKNKKVEQYSAVPYLAALLNSMMWLLYALPTVQPHNMLIMTMSGVGLVIELIYIAIFLAYSVGAARRRVLLILVAVVAFAATVAALVLNLAHTHTLRSMVVGILCVIVETGMYAAPLAVMKMVIQTKSVEYMPLFLSLATLACGISWTAYALIKFDIYIIIPNVLGVMFTVVQMILYAIYYKSTQQILEARKGKTSQIP